MPRFRILGSIAIALVALPVTAGQGAAPHAVAAPTPAPPVIANGLRVNGMMVQQETVMRPMTPAEAEANAVWSLRAGLNVAALQCQFSPFLATVRTYNDLLRHHSAELAAAQASLMTHFKRLDGTRAANSFDQYTTRTYNSFSTLDAQYAFCDAAALIGRGALMLVKGGLGKYALAQSPVLRAALTPVEASATLRLIDAQPVALPVIDG